jgi:hypothetical protein
MKDRHDDRHKEPSHHFDGPFCLSQYHMLCPSLGQTCFREIWLKRLDRLSSSSR